MHALDAGSVLKLELASRITHNSKTRNMRIGSAMVLDIFSVECVDAHSSAAHIIANISVDSIGKGDLLFEDKVSLIFGFYLV